MQKAKSPSPRGQTNILSLLLRFVLKTNLPFCHSCPIYSSIVFGGKMPKRPLRLASFLRDIPFLKSFSVEFYYSWPPSLSLFSKSLARFSFLKTFLVETSASGRNA